MVTLPKSTREGRLIENADIADVYIAEHDVAALDTLDEHLVAGW